MREGPTAIERAIALAKGGKMSCLTELRARLRAEGYGNEAYTVSGKGLKMQLLKLIAEAKEAANAAASIT